MGSPAVMPIIHHETGVISLLALPMERVSCSRVYIRCQTQPCSSLGIIWRHLLQWMILIHDRPSGQVHIHYSCRKGRTCYQWPLFCQQPAQHKRFLLRVPAARTTPGGDSWRVCSVLTRVLTSAPHDGFLCLASFVLQLCLCLCGRSCRLPQATHGRS
jgi:hypothetical protein